MNMFYQLLWVQFALSFMLGIVVTLGFQALKRWLSSRFFIGRYVDDR